MLRLVAKPTVLNQNIKELAEHLGIGAGCKLLSFLKIYLKCASYTWMFCEGFYLHRLMSNAFSPPRSLLSLYALGWGLPLVSSMIYAILRLIYANESPSLIITKKDAIYM
ncbi:hypothetical protein KUTeg_008935 [Tegillarca granosa]|uniref:G-protein coupled receptors family 2 profile 2 domain-containing protein n=1 Tax=Tegillarca granosa TaxID=220873 RepID=A0ABQ9FAJ9_TEGGR|nr:hypothetical protein KUTeg_008935 [Tegillarca granosa]